MNPARIIAGCMFIIGMPEHAPSAWPANSTEAKALATTNYRAGTAIRFGPDYFQRLLDRIEQCPE